MPVCRRNERGFAVLLMVLSAGALLRGASDAAREPGTAPVVRLTAIVTDTRGQLLAGLKPADFDLLVDGTPHQVDAVVLNDGPSTPRAFAFLLDEFHTAAADAAAVRDALLRFVEAQLRPNDVAYVLKPLDSLTSVVPVADREALRQSIAGFEGRKGDYTPRTTFERNYMAQTPAAVAAARAQIVTSALRTLATTVSRRSDVRPAIVLVGDGFERMRAARELPANLQSAIRIANRADTPVYAFAPSLVPPRDAKEAVDPAYAALRALTAQTGGELVAGTHALPGGLLRMSRDLDRHYVLTYKPAHGSDGRFHTVRLAVRREGAAVRSRTGYVAEVPAAAMVPQAATPPARILRRSPLIQSWAGSAPAGGSESRVTFTWEPSLPRTGTASAARRPERIILTASSADGTVLFDAAVAPASAPASDDTPTVATFVAPPGAVRVDVKILDRQGVVLDTDARDLAVRPLPKEGAAIYPPAVMRIRSGRDLRIALEGGAAPVPTRDFRRADRLLVRVPAADAAGRHVAVAAELLNRLRQPMRTLPAMSPAPGEASWFDLPLAGLAPGEYTLRFSAGAAADHVSFRVIG